MTITIDKDIFTEKITIASRFTSNKVSSVATLQGILIKGEKDQVSFYSTNLNTYFYTSISSQVSEPFQIIIEPKKILEFLSFLPSGDITLDIKERQMTIKMKKSKGNFPYMTGSDFPFPPEVKGTQEKIDSKVFLSELPLVLFSASNDESRPVLTGINFVNSDSDMLIVATDGFRLSILKNKKLGDFPSMIVPADFLQEVVRYMKDEKEVTFSYSAEERMVYFAVGSNHFYSRLIEGDYPPFERVIPPETKTTVTLDRIELQRSIKLVSVFARDFSNVIVCECKKDGITLRPKKEGNEENHAFLEGEFEGEEQTIAFNFKFVLDFLNNVEGKQIILEILRPDAPAVFKTETNAAFMHIIMPIRIQE